MDAVRLVKYRGWSMHKVARHVGVEPSTVSRWCKGHFGTGWMRIPTRSSRPKGNVRHLVFDKLRARYEPVTSPSKDARKTKPPIRAVLFSAFSPRDVRESPRSLHHLYIYGHSRRKIQIRESLDYLGRRIQNINEAFMDAHLKLLARIFVHER